MDSVTIRQKFIKFFKDHGHQPVPSSPLVPAGDPTLLFTNAGMVQFKDVFLGQDHRTYQRAVSVQKCMRAGGKHNDLDQVGRTARHQTFFEMLGNFSFGDYFKRDAIRFAWKFLTEELGISPDVLWVTVFETDDEAYQLWQEVAGVSAQRIVRMGEADNFWSMGDIGPCGPSSEIFVDRGVQYACGDQCGLGHCECDRVQEIWNLVFMQYDRDESGKLTPLPKPSIDTGMGLERVTAYLQGVESNFDTDLIFPLIAAVERLSNRTYQPGEEGMPFRVIADHVRAITFLLAEGVSFSNEGRGFVMRRILRRAVRYGLTLGFEHPFLWQLVPVVDDILGTAYPEISVGSATIQQLVREEEERFQQTLASGMKVLTEKLDSAVTNGRLSGYDAFLLHDTYGFPLDLTMDAAAERGILVETEGFDAAMAEQRERARANRAAHASQLPYWGKTVFTGYETLSEPDCLVETLYVDQDRVERLENGMTGWVWLNRTPFYPEGGGQVGDQGVLSWPTGSAHVLDTIKQSTDIWHLVEVQEGYLVRGQTVVATVSKDHREGAMRNHTGTHLLHAALRHVLGDGVRQTGSLVTCDRLRFDFSYPRALSDEQIHQVENLVNEWILADRPVSVNHMDKEQALADGALAFFGDKYGESVRVITVEGASRELCGGTHCQRTGQIGLFAIVEDASVGSGNRRVEAVTGWNALERMRQLTQVVNDIRHQLKGTSLESLPTRVTALLEDVRRLELSVSTWQQKSYHALGRQLSESAMVMEGGMRILVAQTEAQTSESLRLVLDGAKETIDAAVLVGQSDDRVSMVVYVGETLQHQGLSARVVVQSLAGYIAGGGGGRDDLAQAGGKNRNGIGELLTKARELFRAKVAAS